MPTIFEIDLQILKRQCIRTRRLRTEPEAIPQDKIFRGDSNMDEAEKTEEIVIVYNTGTYLNFCNNKECFIEINSFIASEVISMF